MYETRKIDIVDIFINELERKKKLFREKNFMEFNKDLCNNILYNNPNYKDTTIILTHMLDNLMTDFIKEVNNYIESEGV